ncbi:VOC family protein [Mycolicibacterium sp. CBM1]
MISFANPRGLHRWRPVGRIPRPDGKLIHAAIEINGSTAPPALGETPVTIHLTVTDVDAKFQRALDAGATVVMPHEDQFWGDRYGMVRDPFGHQWSPGQPVREVSYEEIQHAMGQS